MIRKIIIFILAIIFLYIAFIFFNFLPSYLKNRNQPNHFNNCDTGKTCLVKSSETPTPPANKINKNISDYQGILDSFVLPQKEPSSPPSDGCYWQLFITSATEFVPNKVVEIDTGIYLTKKSNNCPYNVGDGAPSEGQLSLAVKNNGKWSFIRDPEKMCPYIKNIPKAKDLLTTLQELYGVCK